MTRYLPPDQMRMMALMVFDKPSRSPSGCHGQRIGVCRVAERMTLDTPGALRQQNGSAGSQREETEKFSGGKRPGCEDTCEQDEPEIAERHHKVEGVRMRRDRDRLSGESKSPGV